MVRVEMVVELRGVKLSVAAEVELGEPAGRESPPGAGSVEIESILVADPGEDISSLIGFDNRTYIQRKLVEKAEDDARDSWDEGEIERRSYA